LVSYLRCKIYLAIERKEKLLSLKLDTLHKHIGWKKQLLPLSRITMCKTERQSFFFTHVKNERIYVGKQIIYVLSLIEFVVHLGSNKR
jgi:hypothetical protein